MMTDTEKKLLQAQHRLEEAQARDRVKERKARTRRLIQEARFWKRCCRRFGLLSCLSWRGIFHKNWEIKLKFQMGGLWRNRGPPSFFSRKGALTHHPKGRWYAYGIVRSPRGISLSAESDRQCHSTCGRCCHRLRDWANTVASTDAIFPTACANLPPAALPQRWTGVLPVHFLFGHQREPPLCRGDTKAYGVEESKKEKVSKLE